MNTPNKIGRIGILGGTFDPIHLGHIQPAKQLLSNYSLDEILLIPVHKPPHKSSTNASTEHRVKMVELACQHEGNFVLDTREIERTTLSYTLDTVKELQSEHPYDELFFIMGMDSLLAFTTWHQWEEILQCCNLIVNTRPGYDLSNINNETKLLLEQYQATFMVNVTSTSVTTGHIYLNNCNELNISSTDIRSKLANNLNCDDLLPQHVLEYIHLHHLYR
jgi:nicotinate-nucleotide adenylyltransferase